MANNIIGRKLSIGPAAHAEEVGAVALLEHRHQHAVRGADRQQVHDDGLQRHQQRTEHDQQEQEAEQQDERDEVRQPLLQQRADVVECGGDAADVRDDTAYRPWLPAASRSATGG